MPKVSIKPQWTIRLPDGQALPARLLELLAQVHVQGSLSAACHEAGTSYRHAWDLIRQGTWLYHQVGRDSHRQARELFREAKIGRASCRERV